MKNVILLFVGLFIGILFLPAQKGEDFKKIEKWGIFEITMKSHSKGNPYMDVELKAEFKNNNTTKIVNGFYDGEGVYKIRFMPEKFGEWAYKTISSTKTLNGKTGSFYCGIPSKSNHGKVEVVDKYHFAYSDGTPYFQFGTTVYAWTHQGDELEEQTLETLKNSAFNKLRFCVFPLSYKYNENEPVYYPFERSKDGENDYTKVNFEFFRHFEKRVEQLMENNIEADIILLHPYDRWGYEKMTREEDHRYIKYFMARMAAYRNVWWSLANEYDLMKEKTLDDWDAIFKVVRENDPYHHLTSIHNCWDFYNYAKPWVTHVSIQSSDLDRARAIRKKYGKPVIYDECKYEGNFEAPLGWGSLSPEEMVHRFWLGVTSGAYVGHSETYKHPEDIVWWTKGGVLYGESPERIDFLHKLVVEAPKGLEPVDLYGAGVEGEYYLYYFDKKLKRYSFDLPKWRTYQVELIDTWEMTITELGVFENEFTIDLPLKRNIAVRIKRIDYIYD